MATVEARRQREAAEEAERRRKAKLQAKQGTPQPKKPKFDFEREKPQIMVSVANAIQAANNLVNSCRVSFVLIELVVAIVFSRISADNCST